LAFQEILHVASWQVTQRQRCEVLKYFALVFTLHFLRTFFVELLNAFSLDELLLEGRVVLDKYVEQQITRFVFLDELKDFFDAVLLLKKYFVVWIRLQIHAKMHKLLASQFFAQVLFDFNVNFASLILYLLYSFINLHDMLDLLLQN